MLIGLQAQFGASGFSRFHNMQISSVEADSSGPITSTQIGVRSFWKLVVNGLEGKAEYSLAHNDRNQTNLLIISSPYSFNKWRPAEFYFSEITYKLQIVTGWFCLSITRFRGLVHDVFIQKDCIPAVC